VPISPAPSPALPQAKIPEEVDLKPIMAPPASRRASSGDGASPELAAHTCWLNLEARGGLAAPRTFSCERCEIRAAAHPRAGGVRDRAHGIYAQPCGSENERRVGRAPEHVNTLLRRPETSPSSRRRECLWAFWLLSVTVVALLVGDWKSERPQGARAAVSAAFGQAQEIRRAMEARRALQRLGLAVAH